MSDGECVTTGQKYGTILIVYESSVNTLSMLGEQVCLLLRKENGNDTLLSVCHVRDIEKLKALEEKLVGLFSFDYSIEVGIIVSVSDKMSVLIERKIMDVNFRTYNNFARGRG